MLVSGNDAAVALAEHIGENIDKFVNLMNEKAKILGINSTHFTSPHGLDQDEHYTTAYDLALLTDYALQNKTFAKIVKTDSYTVNINGRFKQLNNTNELLGYLDGVYGVKTGFTNGANRCLVTACKREDLDIICVVLGCDTKKDRTKDSIELINYTFNNYSIVNIKSLIKKEFENWNQNNKSFFSINKSTIQNPNIIIDETQIPYENIAIKNSDINNIKLIINANSYQTAPIPINAKLGEIEIEIPNSALLKIDLLNQDIIKKNSIFYYINMFLKDYFSLLTF